MAIQNRVLHQQETIFVSQNDPTGSQASGTMSQMYGIQSLGFDFNTSLADVNELGVVGPTDQLSISPNKVTLNFNYLVKNTRNESGLGFYVGGDLPILKDILTGLYKEKNYYIGESPFNSEIVGYTGDYGVIGIGNAVMTNYTAEGRVGSFPTASLSVEGLDINFSTTRFNFDNPGVSGANGFPLGTFVTLPVANSGVAGMVSALKPGDVVVSLGSAAMGFSSFAAQSYQFSVPLNTNTQEELGNPVGTRELTPPFKASANFDVIRRDLTGERLSDLRCANGPYNLIVTIRKPSCTSTPGNVQVQYTLKNAKLLSESFAQQIGQGGTVNLAFEATAGASDTTKGLFISGSLI